MNCPKLRTDTAVLLICAATLLLGIWGILAIVTSQAEHPEPLRLAGRQTVFLLTGFALLEMIRRIPFDFFRRRKFILEIAALCSLWALPIAGERINGMCGWYRIGDFYCQPSELTKAVFLLSMAVSFSGMRNDWRRFREVLPALLLWVIPLVLQPDFGTAGVYTASLFCLYFLAGGSWKKLCALGMTCAAAGLYFIYRHPYIQRRFIGLYTDLDPLGAGWHVAQLKLAIARGGWFGTKMDGAYWSNAYVPLAYNDSAFATMLETLGFLGSLPVLLAGIVLIYALIALALQKHLRRENRLLIAGSAFLTAFQALLHISVNVCLIPPTGLTLPLISYGGSSFIGCCVTIGLALSAATEKSRRNN
ncbi:MAG: FtsW/RodA/SpoVE family cell cycle protein [Lentisphaeria bacterium]|nr:FtsW/RodA/SpoVE family cell cycle protein [Lentisphaeria bacterium]